MSNIEAAIGQLDRIAGIQVLKGQEPGKPSFVDYLNAAKAINTQGRSLLDKLRIGEKPSAAEQVSAGRKLSPKSLVKVEKDGQVKEEWVAFDVNSGLAGFEVTEVGPEWKIRYKGEDKPVKKGSHLRLSQRDSEEAKKQIAAGKNPDEVISAFAKKYSQITDWDRDINKPQTEQAPLPGDKPAEVAGPAAGLITLTPEESQKAEPSPAAPAGGPPAEQPAAAEVTPDLSTPEKIKDWLEDLRQTPASVDALNSRVEQIFKLAREDKWQRSELWLRACEIIRAGTVNGGFFPTEADKVDNLRLWDELRGNFPGSHTEYMALDDAYFEIELGISRMRSRPGYVFDSEMMTKKKFAEQLWYDRHFPDNPSKQVVTYLSAINKYREEIGEAPLTLEQLFPPSVSVDQSHLGGGSEATPRVSGPDAGGQAESAVEHKIAGLEEFPELSREVEAIEDLRRNTGLSWEEKAGRIDAILIQMADQILTQEIFSGSKALDVIRDTFGDIGLSALHQKIQALIGREPAKYNAHDVERWDRYFHSGGPILSVFEIDNVLAKLSEGARVPFPTPDSTPPAMQPSSTEPVPP